MTRPEQKHPNGLAHESVVNTDLVYTIPVGDLLAQLGWFHPDQEHELSDAVQLAFDLT
jgi:mRNA interferase MazF